MKHGITVSPTAKDLIKRLLDKNKKKRIGAAGDISEILAHPFFQGIDIEKLQRKELEPPYKPEINDDLKYFDAKLTAREDFAESIIEESHLRLIQQN